MKTKYDITVATMLGYMQGTNAIALAEIQTINHYLQSDVWTREDTQRKVTALEERLTEAQNHVDATLKQSYEDTMNQLQL